MSNKHFLLTASYLNWSGLRGGSGSALTTVTESASCLAQSSAASFCCHRSRGKDGTGFEMFWSCLTVSERRYPGGRFLLYLRGKLDSFKEVWTLRRKSNSWKTNAQLPAKKTWLLLKPFSELLDSNPYPNPDPSQSLAYCHSDAQAIASSLGVLDADREQHS